MSVHGGPRDAELAALGLDPARVLDFSVSTNPYGPCRSVIAAVRAAALDRYPDPTGHATRAAMAPHLGVAPDELALRNGVNANLLRHWMKLGHWQSGTPTLLPVTVLAQQPCADVVATTLAQPSTGTVEIELCGAVIRLSGQVDAAQLTTVLAALRA